MRNAKTAIPGCFILLFSAAAAGRGVSPYLPLNMEPETELQIERVLILGDQPVMTRPIAAATVLAALPKACKRDRPLCERVARYLARYTRDSGVTHASVAGAATSGADTTLPNRYGLHNRSAWDASAQAYIQPADHLLVSLGGEAYDGQQNLTGTMLSVGFDWAQLDLGFRPHWFSPLSDSSMLISTEAPTMPSATISNFTPLTGLGLHYELFAARMSESDHIEFNGSFTSGKPRLAGIHLDMQPVSGWSLGVSRLMQYGGGARGRTGIRDLFDAFFNPSGADNPNISQIDNQFGNQVAAVTSSVLFPVRVPFAVYAEYAGEDTSHGKNYLLGNSALSVGIHFPRLLPGLDLTVETSEWQNAWYVHSIYQDGLTNRGRVIGSWFGDQRVFPDAVGGNSEMVRVGWEPPFGGLLELQYRTLLNQSYGLYRYEREQDASVTYSHPWRDYTLGASVEGGKDYFGASFSRVSGFIRLNEGGGFGGTLAEAIGDGDSYAIEETRSGELFVDAGLSEYQVSTNLNNVIPRSTTTRKSTPHFAVGARRVASEHNDLGIRLEFDDVDGHALVGVRLLDYRYRFDGPFAIGAFVGAERYALATPAYGFYYGAGIQWRNVLPGCDLAAEFRYSDSIARDHLLPSDPPTVGPQNDSFYDVTSTLLTFSYHF
jgi:hypothetical protein